VSAVARVRLPSLAGPPARAGRAGQVGVARRVRACWPGWAVRPGSHHDVGLDLRGHDPGGQHGVQLQGALQRRRRRAEAIAAGISHKRGERWPWADPLYGTSIGALDRLQGWRGVRRRGRPDEHVHRGQAHQGRRGRPGVSSSSGRRRWGRNAALAVGMLLAAVAKRRPGSADLRRGRPLSAWPAGGFGRPRARDRDMRSVLRGGRSGRGPAVRELPRGARGIAVGVLAAAYLVMSAGAAAGCRRPAVVAVDVADRLGSPRSGPTRAIAGRSSCCPLAAAVRRGRRPPVVLAARRDLGAGLVPARPGRAAGRPGRCAAPLAPGLEAAAGQT